MLYYKDDDIKKTNLAVSDEIRLMSWTLSRYALQDDNFGATP